MTSSIIDQIVAKRIHSPISFWGRGSKPVLTKKNAFTFSNFPLFLNHIARGSALGPFTLKSWSWKVSPPFEISHALFETKLALFTFIELWAGLERGLRLWISSPQLLAFPLTTTSSFRSHSGFPFHVKVSCELSFSPKIEFILRWKRSKRTFFVQVKWV